MARSVMKWSASFRMDPKAKTNTMGQDAVRAQMQETGRNAKSRIAAEVTNPAYRSRLMFRTYKDQGVWKLWVGTWSSFAHWEEFGAMNWNGPIAPMRRVMHSMGFRMIDYGPNSLGPPS